MSRLKYTLQQLRKTLSKTFENYVITRLLTRLNDPDVKFICQQVVQEGGKRWITDLFFPQLKTHIEVDEKEHTKRVEHDFTRQHDIENATGHTFKRISEESFEKVNESIDAKVKILKGEIEEQKKNGSFKPWDPEKEMNPDTYIERGKIEVKDRVAFRTIVDACKCFGREYKKIQRGGVKHPRENDNYLWFPKFYPNGIWNNTLSDDEEVIEEEHTDEAHAQGHRESHLKKDINKRIVFGHVKDNLGNVFYRFFGEFTLDRTETRKLTWKRTSESVKTYPYKKNGGEKV